MRYFTEVLQPGPFAPSVEERIISRVHELNDLLNAATPDRAEKSCTVNVVGRPSRIDGSHRRFCLSDIEDAHRSRHRQKCLCHPIFKADKLKT